MLDASRRYGMAILELRERSLDAIQYGITGRLLLANP
jgi:hypothetical protein